MSDKTENRSFSDERSTEPYNADKVSLPEMLSRLQKAYPDFKGDWSHLERLVRNLDAERERDKEDSLLANEDWLSEWNGWVRDKPSSESIHLEGAVLRGAHLVRAVLEGAHLEGADLAWTHLQGANLAWTHLEGANLKWAHLQGAVLEGAHLDGADLAWTHLEGANLKWAHLQGAVLKGAHLEGADLAGACLEGATLAEARLEGADMVGAYLEGATLASAHLEGADLIGAVLDQADVRGATGLRFDDNSVYRIRIEGNAKDPWSGLRRAYSGPRFFLHLLLLTAFFTPYAAKFLYLSVLSRTQDYVLEKAETVKARSDELEQRLRSVADEHATDAPWLAETVTAAADYGRTSVDALKAELSERYRKTPAALVMLGWTDPWWWLSLPFAIALIAYNGFRAWLTLRVTTLRDAEERAQITPKWDEYRRLHAIHRWIRWIPWTAVSVTAVHILVQLLTTQVYVPC